jgi:hypothetical protein
VAWVGFWREQGACGGCVRGFVLVWREPEDVDVAFFIVGVGWLAEFGKEGGGRVWGDGWWD